MPRLQASFARKPRLPTPPPTATAKPPRSSGGRGTALPEHAGRGDPASLAPRPGGRALPQRAKTKRRPFGSNGGSCFPPPRLSPGAAGQRCPSPGYLCCRGRQGGPRSRRGAGRGGRRSGDIPLPGHGHAVSSPPKPPSPRRQRECPPLPPPPGTSRLETESWGSRGSARTLRAEGPHDPAGQATAPAPGSPPPSPPPSPYQRAILLLG